MGWSYNFWRGSFYPADAKPAKFLSHYAKLLDTVEVDSTFYRIPREETVVDWKRQTPEGFLFSIKFPQKITHVKMLKDADAETEVFLKRTGLLGEKLGVLLLQFSPMFTYQRIPLLREYFGSLPKGRRYAVEVRNKTLLNEELFKLLRDRNVALVWVDAEKMPAVNEETSDFIYLRWEGDRKAVHGTLGRREADRTPQIEAWSHKIKALLQEDKTVFGYFSKYYSGLPTSDAELLLKLAIT